MARDREKVVSLFGGVIHDNHLLAGQLFAPDAPVDGADATEVPDAPVDGADATEAPDAPEAAIDPPAGLDKSPVGHFPVEMMLEGCAVRRANWAPGWTLVIGRTREGRLYIGATHNSSVCSLMPGQASNFLHRALEVYGS